MAVPTQVLLRDLIIFHLKLLMDGLKDVVLFQLSIVAAAYDLVLGRRLERPLFYRVVSLSERFDLWLNLNGGSRTAHVHPDGLFGESTAGSDTLLGKLEEIARGSEIEQRSRAAWERRRSHVA